MVGWGVAPGPVVCERTAYVHDSRRGWVWVYWSWLDIHSEQSTDCVSPAWRPYERHELQELQNAIAQTLQDNISSLASVPAVHTGVPLVTNDDSDPEEDPEEAMKAVVNEMEKVSKYRDARERGEIYPKVKRLDNIKLPTNHEISQNRIFHQCVANDDSDDGQNPEEAIVAQPGEESLSLKDAESSTSWVKDQRSLAVTLCKVTSAMARMDLLNLGCSSRCMSVVFESEHKDQTTRNPFSTHSMLRPKHVAHIVSTLSACLLETVEPYKEHGHPLLPHLQLRTACRWVLQAMHRPMKARANSLLYRLEELRRFQADLLSRPFIKYGLLAPCEKQAIEIVTTQHRTMTRILDSGILDIMLLPFSGRRGVVLGMTHRNLAMDLENQTEKQRREKEEWFWA